MRRDDEIYAAIGRAITEWNAAEEAFLKFFCSILNCRIEQAGIIWHSSHSFTSKIEMIDSLILEMKSDKILYNFWKKLKTYSIDLYTRLNQIAHREIEIEIDKNEVAKGNLNSGTKKLYSSYWNKTAKGIRQNKKGPLDLDEIEFASREFSYLRMTAMSFYLSFAGQIDWPAEFKEPFVRLKKTDGAYPKRPES
jgi:hypothetical protein